jgi:predicted kinase
MTLTIKDMRVTIEDRAGARLRERLHQRLAVAAELHCAEHDRRVVSVSIHARENGWFDATWTTCCETLEQQAVAIVKERL